METNKKQTAVQLVIEQLHKHKRILKDHFEEGKWNDDRCSEIDNCILICESKLPMEREQIEKDYNSGFRAGVSDYIDVGCGIDSKELTAEQYYEQTYGKDEK